MTDYKIVPAKRQGIKPRSGANNSNWKGGKTVSVDGRVLVYSPEHPYPNWKNYVYRYRLVVEEALGRFLAVTEIVHHKNGDPSDDRLENLELMTKPDHHRLHASVCKNNGLWSLKYPCCISCSTNEIKHHGRGLCDKCYDKKRKRIGGGKRIYEFAN